MQKSNFKVPVGIALTLIVGLVGFRDTGIFVNSFNAKLNNGVEVSFSPNNRAEIVGEGASKTTYLVESEGSKVYVPKEVLLKVDNGVNGYRVLKNAPLFDENGEVIRVLSLDEYLTFVANKGDKVLVKTNDGFKGLVSKAALDPDRIRNIVNGIAKEDLFVDNGNQTLSVREGGNVNVAWFEKDYFIVYDNNQNKFKVPKEKISIFEKKLVEETKEVEKMMVKAFGNPLEKPESLSNESADTVQKIIQKAYTLIGSPYVYGDTGKAGYDCSGLVYSLYGEFTDVKLPRSSREMAEVGTYVTEEDLEAGDFLFFTSKGGSTINHVALYIGNGMMIHASNSQDGVVLNPIEGTYFNTCFSHARRVLK